MIVCVCLRVRFMFNRSNRCPFWFNFVCLLFAHFFQHTDLFARQFASILQQQKLRMQSDESEPKNRQKRNQTKPKSKNLSWKKLKRKNSNKINWIMERRLQIIFIYFFSIVNYKLFCFALFGWVFKLFFIKVIRLNYTY